MICFRRIGLVDQVSDCEELVGICIIENHEFIDSQSLYNFHGSGMK